MFAYGKGVTMSKDIKIGSVEPTAVFSGVCEHCSTKNIHQLYNARGAGLITGFNPATISNWRKDGFLLGHQLAGNFLYEEWQLRDALYNKGYSREHEHTTVERR